MAGWWQFERLLGICGSEGGPGGGNVVVQDAAELMNNLLRDNLANQRLFRWGYAPVLMLDCNVPCTAAYCPVPVPFR
jgi:hypothetical protein